MTLHPCTYHPRTFFGDYTSLNILLGRCVPLTMRPLNEALPGRCVPYQCVPTMDHIQVVDNHNSNSSFAHANSTHRLLLQSWPNLSHYNVSNPSEFVTCLLSRIFLCLPPLTITARQVVLFHCYCLLLNFDLGKRLRSWEKNIPVNMNVNNWINIGINLSWALVVLRGKYENIIVYTMYRNFPLVWR